MDVCHLKVRHHSVRGFVGACYLSVSSYIESDIAELKRNEIILFRVYREFKDPMVKIEHIL